MPSALGSFAQGFSKSFDLPRLMVAKSALETSRLKNRLLQSKIDRENTLSTLRGQIAASQTAGGEMNENAGLMRQYMALDPEGATKMITAMDKMDARQLAKVRRQASLGGKLALALEDMPMLQRSGAYGKMRAAAEAQGLDVSGLPDQYDPAEMRMALIQSLDVDKYAEMLQKKRLKKADMIKVMGPKGPVWVPADQATGQQPGETEPLVETYDPNSPTGTTYRTRTNAVGQPGKPPTGYDIEVGPDGKVHIRQGRGVGDLSKRSQGEVEGRILKAGDTISQLTAIKNRFKPEYQQLATRWDALTTALAEKAENVPVLDWLAGSNRVTPEQRKQLEDFTAYRAEAGQLFGLTLKDLSGVAVNPTEYKRAEVWLPNPGTGLFDGDSPSQLKAKVDRFEDFTRKALIKYHYIRRNGLKVDDVDVNDMPKIVRKRGDELAKMYREANPTAPEESIRESVKRQLMDEFGLAVQ